MPKKYNNMDDYMESVTITDLQKMISDAQNNPNIKSNNREKKILAALNKQNQKWKTKMDNCDIKTAAKIIKKFVKAASKGQDTIWIYYKINDNVIRLLNKKAFEVKYINLHPIFAERKSKGYYRPKQQHVFLWELILNVNKMRAYAIKHAYYSYIYRIRLETKEQMNSSSSSSDISESTEFN